MAQERPDELGMEDGREDEAEDRAVEVGGVVDVVPAAACHVLAISQVEEPEDDAGDGDDGEEEYFVPGVEEDGGEEDGGDGARRADGGVGGVVAVAHDVGDGGCRHAPEVEGEECPAAKAEVGEHLFDVFAEGPEGEHVHEEVYPVCVDEAVGDDAVPFPVAHHAVRAEGEFVEQLPVPEAEERDGDCGDGDEGGQHII